MKRVCSILMAFCLMFSLLGNTAAASELSAVAVPENTEENAEVIAEVNNVSTVSGNSPEVWDGGVSSGDALPTQLPVQEEETETITGPEELIPEGAAESGTPPEVTRIQWLHELTELFEMSVTADNYPDNYYSDMNAESEYYYDVMLATEFGLIDTPAGEAFMPQEAATREFAARTLSLCLGYVLEDKTYTYTEASTVTYPDDIQIAVNRGWFQLKNGAFLPQQPITAAEKELMLQDARRVRESEVVDQDYNGSYQFVSDVIVVPEGTRVELTDENQLTIYDCPVSLKTGDKFAVIPDGFPVVYRAAQIAESGNKTVITCADVDTKEAFVSLDVQGSSAADLARIQAIDETTEINYIVGGTEEKDWEDGEKLETLELVGEREISAVEIIQEYDIPDHVREEFEIAPGVKLKLVCKISDINFDYKASNTGVYVGLNTKVSLQCNLNADIREAMGYEKSITLIKVPVGCLGFLTSSVDMSLGGKVTFSMAERISMGVQYNWGQGFRLVKDFHKESFTIQIEAKASICANLSWKVNYGVVKGSIYGKVGVQAKISTKRYTDGKAPSECVDVGAWLFATYGCEIKVNLFLINVEWKKELKAYNEKNSPIRVYFHFDDGISVTECGRDSAEGGGTGTDTGGKKYYTPINSQYGYSGINSGTTPEGEPYAVFEYSLDKVGNATITKYNGNMSALSIPETLDGHTVAGIADRVFADNTRLRIVVIPDSVTEIGSYAFSECSNLASVTMSKNVAYIGYSAFYNCDKLTSIEIPKSLQDTGYTGLGGGSERGVFQKCDGLKEIYFERGTTEIARGLFANCPGIERMVIPDTVTVIESEAFYGCVNLKEIVIPGSVTEIDDSAFERCEKLQTVVIPDSVTEIRRYAFSECSNLASVTLSKNVAYIGYSAFYNCDKLTSIEIPKSLQDTGYTGLGGGSERGVFQKCDGLKEVYFERGTREIARGLFANCPGIERMVIPDTVTVIEGAAFYGCVNLKEIVIPGSVTEIEGSAFERCEKLQAVVIPDSVTEIGNYAFSECSNLASVTLSKNVTYIGYAAFYNCDKITSIEIPKSLQDTGNPDGEWGVFKACDGLKEVYFEKGTTEIAEGLFANCSGIERIVIPDTVTVIEDWAFKRCINLREIVLPDSVTEIENLVFWECEKLQSIVIPNSVTKMGRYVFYNCSSLQKAVLPTQITSIPDGTFENCSSLTEIKIPNTVTDIGYDAFRNCTALTEIKISNIVTDIGDGAFRNCTALAKVTMGDKVKTIGSYVFYNCDALTTITLPDSVTSLGSYVFADCELLSEVKLGTGITKIPSYAFDLCPSLQKIVLPYRVAQIDGNAFTNCTGLTEIVIPRSATKIADNVFSYPAKMTIYGISGTYAQEYAEKIGAKFVHQETPAEKVTLSESEITLNRGTSTNLVLAVTPADFTDLVSWRSTDSTVVTVDDSGRLTARAVGTATIKVTVGSQSASCQVTVTQPVTSISFWPSSVTMEAGEEKSLTASVYPSDANNKKVTWASSDKTIATVDQSGKITAIKKGTAQITATAQDGSDVSGSCTVTVANNLTVCQNVSQLESPHNYGINSSDAWTYTRQGAGSIVVTFDAKTNVEENFDFLYLYDKQGKEVGKYTGTQLAGKSVTISGDTVKIKLVSDDAGTAWGFKVTSVEAGKLQAAAPTITRSGDKLVIRSSMDGCTIYYTTDGTTPTVSNGTKADGSGVTLDTFSGTLQAIAVKSGYGDSDVARLNLINSDKNRNVAFTVKGVIGGREVTFGCNTSGAKVYYSTTSSTITAKDKCVKAGETVLFENFYGTVYARSYYNGEWGNVCRLVLKIPVVNTPSISTDNKGNVTIRTTTPSSIIYYTTDGSVPSPSNGTRVNASSVTLPSFSGTLQAIAVRSCFTNSTVASKNLINGDKSRNVSFAVKGVFGGRDVTFGCAMPGAKVYYSTTTSRITTKDKCVNAGETVLFENFYGTVYARSYCNGEWGNVCRLVLKIPVVSKPTISIDGRGYATIRTATPGCYLYYTTDGSTPSMTNGRRVSASQTRVYVGRGVTVKAIAVRSCFTNSQVAEKR